MFDGSVKVARPRNRQEFRRTDIEIAEQRFLRDTILRRLERRGRGIDGNAVREEFRGFDRDVFKFVSDELQTIREFFERGVIRVVRGDALRDAAHGSLGRRVEKAEMQAERVARER